MLKTMYWKMVSIFEKTFLIYFGFCMAEYMILLSFPKISEDIIVFSQTMQHLHQYTRYDNRVKVNRYKKIAEGYITDFYNDTQNKEYNKKIKPDVYVLPRSSLYSKLDESNAIAFCNIDSGNIIILTDDQFENQFFHYPNFVAKSVIYHELGHCILKLKHKNNGYNIMNAEVESSDTVFQKVNMWAYLREVNVKKTTTIREMQNKSINKEDLQLMFDLSKRADSVFSFLEIKSTAIANLMEVDPIFRSVNSTALKYRMKIEAKIFDK